MPIDQEVIEQAKRTDLVALIQAKGITLKNNGKSQLGLCPFHADKNPSLSINTQKNLWQCFGCGAAGDAIRFVELFDQVDFKETVKRLTGNGFKRTPPAKTDPPKPLSAKLRKLLNRVIEFYHTVFGEDPRAAQYLESRGITDKSLYSAHKIGFANGTLSNVLPMKGDVTAQLKDLGVLTDKGRELFYGCVTFPLLDAGGNPAGIYGRRIDDISSGRDGADHLYLPGPCSGLFNRQAAGSHKDILLTESIIDSLTLLCAGIGNTIPCHGVKGFTGDHLQWLKRCAVETVHVCFDGDESGRKAADKTATTLEGRGFKVHRIDLAGGQDINDFFLLSADPAAEFKKLAGVVDPWTEAKQAAARYTPTDYGFSAVIGGRHYEVRGITRQGKKGKEYVYELLAAGEIDEDKPFLIGLIDIEQLKKKAEQAGITDELGGPKT